MNRRPGSFTMLVALASGFAVGWAIYHMLLTGSCSTPAGPGEVECPPEMWHYVVALVGGIMGGFVSGIVSGGSLVFVSVFGGIGLGGVLAGLDEAGERWYVLFGLCFLLTPVVMLLSYLGVGLRRVRAAALMSHGIPATGTVLAVEDTHVIINGNPRVRMTFHVVPNGGVLPPFDGTKTTTVPRISIPRVGDSYPVFVDPENSERWMVAVAGPPMSQGALRRVVDLARHGAGPAMPPVSS